jgi:hypothetical protein
MRATLPLQNPAIGSVSGVEATGPSPVSGDATSVGMPPLSEAGATRIGSEATSGWVGAAMRLSAGMPPSGTLMAVREHPAAVNPSQTSESGSFATVHLRRQ